MQATQPLGASSTTSRSGSAWSSPSLAGRSGSAAVTSQSTWPSLAQLSTSGTGR
jgi:hypothetical protein